MTTYSLFAGGNDVETLHTGLSLEQAFALVLEFCRFDHVFERRPGGHALIIWDRSLKSFAPQAIETTFTHTSDARTVLMLKAIDGRFRYRALSDESVRELLCDPERRTTRGHETTRAS